MSDRLDQITAALADRCRIDRIDVSTGHRTPLVTIEMPANL